MIWDCILYSGEDLMLDIRMEELAQIGQPITHVLVEGEQTFQGKPRKVVPVQLPNVIHHVVDLNIEDCDCGCADAIQWTPSNTWIREAHQRNAVMDVLKGAGPTDFVLLGDADEIPSADIVDALFVTYSAPHRFLMDAYFFRFDWFGGKHIPGTVAANIKDVTTPAEMRHAEMATVDGGWHFTYMGGVSKIMEKVKSFSHDEMANFLPHVWEKAIETGWVPWTGAKLEKADLSKLPASVREFIRHAKDPH